MAQEGSQGDPFTKFWADMMARMSPGPAGATPAGAAQEEWVRQTRQVFFDAWSRSCEEFMRSEAFLEMMKQSMDAALGFRKQMNDFFSRALHDTQVPSREDAQSIMQVLRGFEERVLGQMEQLSQRVEALERQASGGQASGPRGRRPSKGGNA